MKKERRSAPRKRELDSLPVFLKKGHAFSKGGLKLGVGRDSNQDYITLSLRELKKFPTTKLTDDFKCLEGWVVSGITWEGIPVARILDKFDQSKKAKWILFGSGRFTCQISRRKAFEKTTLLATKMNGKRLTGAHGGPLRLVFKGQKCYESIKSVDRIVALERRSTNTTARRIAISRIT